MVFHKGGSISLCAGIYLTLSFNLKKKVAHNQTCEVEWSYFRGKETGVDQREGGGGLEVLV